MHDAGDARSHTMAIDHEPSLTDKRCPDCLRADTSRKPRADTKSPWFWPHGRDNGLEAAERCPPAATLSMAGDGTKLGSRYDLNPLGSAEGFSPGCRAPHLKG